MQSFWMWLLWNFITNPRGLYRTWADTLLRVYSVGSEETSLAVVFTVNWHKTGLGIWTFIHKTYSNYEMTFSEQSPYKNVGIVAFNIALNLLKVIFRLRKSFKKKNTPKCWKYADCNQKKLSFDIVRIREKKSGYSGKYAVFWISQSATLHD